MIRIGCRPCHTDRSSYESKTGFCFVKTRNSVSRLLKENACNLFSSHVRVSKCEKGANHLKSPSKCLLALLIHECSSREMFAYKACKRNVIQSQNKVRRNHLECLWQNSWQIKMPTLQQRVKTISARLDDSR